MACPLAIVRTAARERQCEAPRAVVIRGQMVKSWQAPGSYSLAKLFERQQVGSERLAVSELYGPVAPLRIKKIQQAGCAVPVSVLADVAGLLRLVQIPGAIKSDDLVVGAQILKGISNVGQHLPVGESLLLLGLGDGKARRGQFLPGCDRTSAFAFAQTAKRR